MTEFMGLHEADITINGEPLTFGQAMAVRVAVSHFHDYLADPESKKLLGPITDGYAARLREVEVLLVS